MAVIPMECVCIHLPCGMFQCFTPRASFISLFKNSESSCHWIVEIPVISSNFPTFQKASLHNVCRIHIERCEHTHTHTNNLFNLSWMVKAHSHTQCAANTFNVIAHFYVNNVIAKVNIPWKSEIYFAGVIVVLCIPFRLNQYGL